MLVASAARRILPAVSSAANAPMLGNRLRRRFRHLRKWARRTGVTCFRVYDRDIAEHPCVVEWYQGAAVVWCLPRRRDTTDAEAEAWHAAVRAAVADAFELPDTAVFLKQRSRQRGTQQYQRLAARGAVHLVTEQDLRFELNLSDYLDVGLFLDHRRTRALVRERSAGKRVLNLFAYTGSFTCHAAAGGASTSLSVDLSRTYTAWIGRNLAHNACDPDRHAIETADCLRFLEQPPQERFQLIVCDPPTFSNSKRMHRTWSVDRDHPWMLWRLHDHLAPGGELVFSSNSRRFALTERGLPPLAMREITDDTVPEDFPRRRPHRCWLMRKG